MASLVAILDLKGKPLIQRSYRDDVPPSYIEKFLPIVLDLEEDGQQVTPCFSREGVNYMHIRHSNLYLLALSKRNSNAAEIILFLHRLVQVLVEYFKELEEESIRDNFVIIYELLDEMMDFGFPQTTESKILQEYITQESYKLEVQVRPPIAVTNAVSWRSEGIRYRKNEVFLDVIESVNLLVNANGNVVRSEILGAVKMKCYLSGMPELRLGLNDKVMFESTGRTARGKAIEMEDVKFHQCVRLSRFENDRTISFIPPDGEFELMSYRLSTPVKPLVWVEAAVEHHKGSRVEYMVKVKAQFKRRSTANNVEIYVPVPDDADTPKFRASTGTVQYAPDKSAFVWKIKQLGGGREFLMRAHFGLPSVRGEHENMDKRAPITVKFEIPYFTVSGIQVRYLKIVEKSGYQALPWVRYITQNGDDYSLRTAQEKVSASIDEDVTSLNSRWIRDTPSQFEIKSVLAILEFVASPEPKREKRLDEALKLMNQVDGAQPAFWGFDVSKGNTGCVIQVWKSLLHHRELLNHDNFTRICGKLAACFARPPTISHVSYDEKSTALQCPVLHIIQAEPMSPDDPHCRQELRAAVKHAVSKIGERAFGGESLENAGVYFVFIGASTIERENPEECSAMVVAHLTQHAVVEHRTLWLKPTVAGPQRRTVRITGDDT